MTTSGPGEVDDHLRAGVGDVEQPVAVVDHRDELEVVGVVDRLDHLGAHAAAGAEHPDVDQRAPRRRGRAGCWSGVEVRWSRGQASRPEARDARQPPDQRARRAAGRAASQSARPSEHADHVGQPVGHRRRPVQRRQPLQHLADRRRSRPAAAPRTAGRIPAHRPVSASASEQRAVHELVHARRRGRHVGRRARRAPPATRGRRRRRRRGTSGAVHLRARRIATAIRAGRGRTRGRDRRRPGRSSWPNSSAATVAHLLLVDGVEPAEHLAHRQVLAVGELALAEPAHPGPGVLEAEHQAALELAAAAGHLLGGDARRRRPGRAPRGSAAAPRAPASSSSPRRRRRRPAPA